MIMRIGSIRKNNAIRFSRLLSSFGFLSSCCILLSCYPTIFVEHIDKVPQNEAIVFGKIIATNALGSNWLTTSRTYRLFISPVDSSNKLIHRIGKYHQVIEDSVNFLPSGNLYWHLKPGKYMITRWDAIVGNWSGSITISGGRIRVSFEVPVASKLVYIGTLRMTLSGTSTISIEDNMDQAITEFENHFSTKAGSVLKHLCVVEE